MPALPPPAAFTVFRRSHQAALQAQSPGTVTIGTRTYACAVAIGPYEPKMQDDGINYRNGQDVVFSIDKTLLATAPEPRTNVTVEGIVYRVVNSGVQNEFDTAWRITARRFA